MSGTSLENKWYNEWQWMTSGTTSENGWYIEWQRVAKRGITSGTLSDNEWQQMTASDHFG